MQELLGFFNWAYSLILGKTHYLYMGRILGIFVEIIVYVKYIGFILLGNIRNNFEIIPNKFFILGNIGKNTPLIFGVDYCLSCLP